MTLAKDDADSLRYMIEQCNDFMGRLNDWEQTFIESISEQLDRLGSLSDAQKEKLEQIYCKLP